MSQLNDNLVEIKRQKDTYLLPENLKKDITIFDITGTYEGSSGFPPNWSEIGYEDTPLSIIEAFNYAKKIQEEWDSSLTSFGYKFQNDRKLLFFPYVDTSNFTSMSQAFSYSTIQSIAPIDSSKATNFLQMFNGCVNLRDVPELDASLAASGNAMWNIFNACTNLTDVSLNNIMKMCISAINYTGTKTLKDIGLTSAQATTCQGLSNYQDFLAAGWTTGY